MFQSFSLNDKVLDIGVHGGGRGNGCDGQLRGSVSGLDLLGVRVILGSSLCLTRVTVVCIVSLFSASEAESLSDTACLLVEVSFLKWTKPTSMASGSPVEQEAEEKEEKGIYVLS